VTPGRDDDALTWDGDDDPTLDVGASATGAGSASEESTDAAASVTAEPIGLPEGYTAVGKGSELLASPFAAGGDDAPDGASDSEATDPQRRQLGNAALIGIGVLAGVYLLLSIGWLLGAARFQLVAALFLEPIAFQVALWLAVLALPLWFVTVLWLTRPARSWVRFVLLIAGAVLLIPWPFVLAGAAL
jgi:hypothetical protein